MKQVVKRGLLLLLAVLLAIPCVGVISAQAASKTKLESSKMTIGIGAYAVNDFGQYTKGTPYTLAVTNAKKGATYSFTSSNKAVVTVKASGKKAKLTGVKAGKATITCKQTLKGKTTTVGTCKVTVKAAKFAGFGEDYEAWNNVGIGTYTESAGTYSGVIPLQYINAQAKYTFTCSDKNFSLKQTNKKLSGKSYQIYQTFTIKKAGSYKVTVKETYKGKTRKVGTVTVTVDSLPVESQRNLYLGEVYGLELVMSGGMRWECLKDNVIEEISDPNVVSLTADDNGVNWLQGKSAGTATWSIYYKNADGSKGDLLASCVLNVAEATVSDIQISEGETGKSEEQVACIDDEQYSIYWSNLYSPEDANDHFFDSSYFKNQINVTVSDESIASVADWDGTDAKLELHQTGTVEVTIYYGENSKTVKLDVVSEEDYDKLVYGYEEDEDEDE